MRRNLVSFLLVAALVMGENLAKISGDSDPWSNTGDCGKLSEYVEQVCSRSSSVGLSRFTCSTVLTSANGPSRRL